MNNESDFRQPTSAERALLSRLFEAAFPGRDELLQMITTFEVRTIDREGSLQLRTLQPRSAPVVKRVPVEARAEDLDGITINVLLHVEVDGRPIELEIFKDDSSAIRRMPEAASFELLVLPPERF